MLTGKSSSIVLSSNTEMMERINAAARRGVARVDCAAFNGGASLFQLLAGVKDRLKTGFEVRVLAWDHRSAALSPKGEITQSLRREIARLDRILTAQGAYDPVFQAADFTELACEYLLLASGVLAVPGRHPAQIAQIASAVETNLASAVALRGGSVSVRKCPIYMPGRMFIIDDQAFFSLYLYNNQVGTILHVRRGQPLFERFTQHFAETWAQASAPLFALGGAAQSEASHWSARAPKRADHPLVFVSYRRADAPWAVGRLYDRLTHAYGREGVFLDTLSIGAASRFPDEIRQTLDKAALLVVVIGPGWLEARDPEGRRRLEDPNDWVVAEILHALSSGKPILPIFVDHVSELDPEKLPTPIRDLSKIQSLRLRFDTFESDSRAILDEVGRLAPPAL